MSEEMAIAMRTDEDEVVAEMMGHNRNLVKLARALEDELRELRNACAALCGSAMYSHVRTGDGDTVVICSVNAGAVERLQKLASVVVN